MVDDTVKLKQAQDKCRKIVQEAKDSGIDVNPDEVNTWEYLSCLMFLVAAEGDMNDRYDI